MRILILSCNTGEGHNSTAAAVRDVAEASGHEVEIWDALSFWPKGTNRFICSGHVFLYKHMPKLFGIGYRFFEMASEKGGEKIEEGNPPSNTGLTLLAKRPSEKLYKKICEKQFDVVVSVHVFSSLMMTDIRRYHGNDLPWVFIATDYTCSPGVNACDFDHCFIPSPFLEAEFLSLGVKKELLRPTGIPVKQIFSTRIDQDEAKSKLHLPADKRIVLMMSGSMGCGPIEKTAEAILNILPDDTVLVAICGKNQKLYDYFTSLPQNQKTLFPVGYTKKVPFYMDAADLIVTKAGGLSSTEAATKHLPMVFMDAIPGLEVHNRDFFVNHGFALSGDKPEEIATAIADLLCDPERLAAMRRSMSDSFKGDAAEQILSVIEETVEQKRREENVPEEAAVL